MKYVVADARADHLLPIHLITAGVDHPQEPRRRPNGAVFHHIFYIQSGEGRFETPEGTHILSAGTALFIRKQVPTAYTAVRQPFHTAWVTFDGPGVDGLLDYFHAGDFACLRRDDIFTMIRACCALADRGAAQAVLSARVYELAVAFFQGLLAERQSPVLQAAKAFIEQNYASDLSVADIARAAGISPSLLYRLFRDEAHATPVDCLRGVRIAHAKALLLGGPDVRVADIAARCGFADTAYFCKVFRAQTGMTPRAYQQRYAL